MPPRLEEELDPVTLHNQALVQTADNPAAGFRRLRYLLAHPPCPPETLGNLLLLQCRHQRYDAAAEILRAHAPLAHRLLSPVSVIHPRWRSLFSSFTIRSYVPVLTPPPH